MNSSRPPIAGGLLTALLSALAPANSLARGTTALEKILITYQAKTSTSCFIPAVAKEKGFFQKEGRYGARYSGGELPPADGDHESNFILPGVQLLIDLARHAQKIQREIAPAQFIEFGLLQEVQRELGLVR
jgi:hypothetical protein